MNPAGDGVVEMAHGAGGHATRRLIEALIRPAFTNPALDALGDAAVLAAPAGRIAMTTDSFVVRPLVFPGGSIGRLAVHGTLNDLAMVGARPLALSAAFVLEAGLPLSALHAEVDAMAAAAQAAGVAIVTGDTKVVEHGKADGMYINTTGLGAVDNRAALGPERVRPGDQVLLSGPIGDHGMTIMLARSELDIQAELVSDTRNLQPLAAALIGALGPDLRWMRDATRGGLATVLCELSGAARCDILIEEQAVPVRDAVRGACELLGIDPLHVANEGQFVAVVAAGAADAALAALRRTPGGAEAVVIGEVRGEGGAVHARSPFGGTRYVDMLLGDPLPRIC